MQVLVRNTGTEFDVCQKLGCCDGFMGINLPAINYKVAELSSRKGTDKTGQIASLLRAVTCIDLTTLCGDDSECNVQRLIYKAVNPIHTKLIEDLGINVEDFHVGAVCVYPARVVDCANTLNRLGSNIPVAAVAAGFPSGQYHLDTKLQEIKNCVRDGAKEIDIVISRDLVIRGEWEALYEEIKDMRKACGKGVTLKTIIAAGELGSFENIYRASIVSMAAGSDFIKTSTGKESVNATLPIGMVMTRAITDYYHETGFEVGFKPAGGIRTVNDVLAWQTLMRNELGTRWLFPNLFRVGASGLLGEIEKTLYHLCTGQLPSKYTFPYQ